MTYFCMEFGPVIIEDTQPIDLIDLAPTTYGKLMGVHCLHAYLTMDYKEVWFLSRFACPNTCTQYG